MLTCPPYWFLTECQEELPASLPLSQFKMNSLPNKIRAHGVVTLGKPSSLCPCVFPFVIFSLNKMIALNNPPPPCHFSHLIAHLMSPLRRWLSGLGKLCLQHEDLVQKYLPVFARELEVGTEVAVRNNVVVIMCDLCVRYTNIVDLYIPNISACLRDDEAIIRENTLIMLTNLLQVGPLLHILCKAAFWASLDQLSVVGVEFSVFVCFK